MKKNIVIVILSVIIVVLAIVLGIRTNVKDIENTQIVNNISDEPTTEMPDALSPETEQSLEKDAVEEENEDIVSGSGSTAEEDDIVLGAKQETPVYYSQVDSRWKNHMYSAIGDPSQTIGTSGCGPTSAAMIVSSIKGSINPAEMGDLYVKYGYRTTNNGTYFSAMKWTADYFDIPFKRVYNWSDAQNLLENGYYVIVSCSEGLFTYGGHFIVIVGIDGNTLAIYDPYLYSGKFDTYDRRPANVRVSGNTAYVSVSNFKKYANATNYFSFKHDGTAVTPTPEPSTGTTMYVNAKSGLNVRSGPGTNYSIITALINGTKVTVYETSNGWSRIGTNRWVSSEYLSSSTSSGGNTGGSTTTTSYTATVTPNIGLNIRSGPGTNYSILGAYTKGTRITITQESSGWGKTSRGWVSLDYISKSSSSSTGTSSSSYRLGRYRVNTPSGLNVRSGPSTSYSIRKAYINGTVFDTYEIRGSWARTPSGWVSLNYCRLIYNY